VDEQASGPNFSLSEDLFAFSAKIKAVVGTALLYKNRFI
jgi:hypothetical protein